MTKGIHKHAVHDPKPYITEKEYLADYQEDYQCWAEAVMDGNTLLGFWDWLKEVGE